MIGLLVKGQKNCYGEFKFLRLQKSEFDNSQDTSITLHNRGAPRERSSLGAWTLGHLACFFATIELHSGPAHLNRAASF